AGAGAVAAADRYWRVRTMKFGTMIGEVFRSLFRQPATRLYPFVRKAAPTRLRGKLLWDAEKCTGCSLCAKDCPSQAIEIIMVDKADKRFAMRYHVDRCTFCSQCVVSCRTGALTMANDDWELASTNKDDFTFCYGDEADVRRLADLAESNAQPSEAG
ncbi:MAG: 4Fe-4S binding protein, partial [Anaerolineae bacterium]|nr:4Fe-4S binding protein [Anaerolineae bacterium]